MRDSFREALFTFFLGLTASVVITIIGYFLDSARGSRTRRFALSMATVTALLSSAAALWLILTDTGPQSASQPSPEPQPSSTAAPLPALVLATPTSPPPTAVAEPPPLELIAFAGREPGRDDYDLYVVRPDGSGLRALLEQSGDDELVPAWSRDGQQIAFLRSVDGVEQLYLMRADGSGRRPLSAGANRHGTPAWAPDGQHLAYHYLQGGDNWDICVALLPVGGCQNLTQEHGGLDINPSWSPAGDQVVFESVRNGVRGLYIVDVADPRNSLRELYVGNLVPRGPKWSPDGNWIAFVGSRVGLEEIESDLYLIRPTGLEGPVWLGETPEKERVPTWSPDNLSIAYHIDGSPRTIWRLELSTGERSLIVGSLTDSYWPAWSPK